MTSIISSGAGGEWWMGRRFWWWATAALQILTTILLSLFLPLSYLLLARLHDFNGGFGSGSGSGSGDGDGDGNFFFAFVFLYFNSTILYLLLSFLAFAAFLNALTGGRVTMIQLLFRNTHQRQSDHGGGGGCPCLSAAWLLLCTSIIVAELGIEYQSSSPSPSPEFRRRSSPGGWFFAVGLYETMMYWSESMVQAVVHDVYATATAVVMGFSREEEEEIKERRRSVVVERVGLGLSFAALWWWRLRHHVDSLAAAATAGEENNDDRVVLKVGDFLSLGLYFLTLFTGVVRAFTGATGMMHLKIRRWRRRKSVTTVRPAPAAAAADVETV